MHLVAVSTEIYDFGPLDYIPRQFQWLGTIPRPSSRSFRALFIYLLPPCPPLLFSQPQNQTPLLPPLFSFFLPPPLSLSSLLPTEEDLKRANANRTLAPWIIVHGHKPLYCSSPTPEKCDNWYRSQREGILPAVAAAAAANVTGYTPSSLRGTVEGRAGRSRRRKWGLEELFYRYGVDVYICGHKHNSERHFDIAPGGRTGGRTREMKATTYIVTGAGGNREGNTPFESEQPRRVASRAESWGYSILEVYNATHLYYEQRGCDVEPKDGGRERDALVDGAWLVQHRHGSFESRAEEEGQEREEGGWEEVGIAVA